MCSYKNSSLCIESAKTVIALKIERETVLLKRYKRPFIETKIKNKLDLTAVFLEEARMAKRFWEEFGKLIPLADFSGRKPRHNDVTNKLLDIGYHHLMNIVSKILDKYEIPTAMGLLHVPRNSDSTPLVYDLVEIFRADIIDAEVLRFLRLKKKKLERADNQIAHFLHEVNERLERKYYLKEFRTCHTYLYYMEVQILKFIKAVNRKEVFKPLSLPDRHENRCS